jgi:hypothetical protein
VASVETEGSRTAIAGKRVVMMMMMMMMMMTIMMMMMVRTRGREFWILRVALEAALGGHIPRGKRGDRGQPHCHSGEEGRDDDDDDDDDDDNQEVPTNRPVVVSLTLGVVLLPLRSTLVTTR